MNKTVYQRCFHNHPALPLKDGLVIYGGSCSDPVVKDADVYVGFDYTQGGNPRSYPWNPGVWFNFPITDMKAPSDPEEFSKLIDWLILQLSANKKVHIGCIGGHGRTGTVMAALVSRFLGVKDAIQYVRKNYCEKAVESLAQIEFLKKHYGVEHAEPAKGFHTGGQADLFNAKYGSRIPTKAVHKESAPKAPEKTKAKMTISAAYRPSKQHNTPHFWGAGVELAGKVLK